MPTTLHGFKDGDRVRHIDWGNIGTVRLFEDPAEDAAEGEIRWDGVAFEDEFDADMAAKLRLI